MSTTIIIGFTEAGKCILCQGRERIRAHMVNCPHVTAIVPCPVCVDLVEFVSSLPGVVPADVMPPEVIA